MNDEDANRIAAIEADLLPFIDQKRAEFVINGITDEQWEEYVQELDRFNMPELMEIRQSNYDNFIDGAGE